MAMLQYGMLSCFELKLTMISKLINLRVTLIIAALWLIRARSDYYCDSGICLNFNATNFATSWEDAQSYCSRNGSILLELYDNQYADVALRAIQYFNSKTFVVGWYFLLGLEYNNGQYRWLTTNKIATQLPLHVPGDFTGTCRCFVVYNGSQLRIEGQCPFTPKNHMFICLKDKVNLATSTEMTTRRLTTTPLLTSSKSTFPTTRISESTAGTKHATTIVKTQQPITRDQQHNLNVAIEIAMNYKILSSFLLLNVLF